MTAVSEPAQVILNVAVAVAVAVTVTGVRDGYAFHTCLDIKNVIGLFCGDT